jgi:DNA-directed RNA polymerase subunit RPC12/RpoP
MTPENGDKPEMPVHEIKPRCPHCSARPCNLSMTLTRFGMLPVAVFICAKCEKIISISVLPPPPSPVEPERSLIAVPGRM